MLISSFQVDWDAVAGAVGYKSGAVASNRFRAIKKNFGLAKGEGLIKRGAAKSRKPRAAGAPAARKPAAKKAGTTTKISGAPAKANFFQKDESDNNEGVEDEEPRNLPAGSDDEDHGESDETSFEEKVTRGDYADSDFESLSEGAFAHLRRQIQEGDLQKKIAEEFEKDFDAYDPDAVLVDAIEEVGQANGHGDEHKLYVREPVPITN